LDKPLKIAIIGPAYPLRGGGIATFNERLARQFLTDGQRVQIFTFSLQYPNFMFPGSTQFSTELAPTDLNIEVCINSVNPFNWLLVGNKIKKQNFDIVVVRFWLPFMGPCLGTLLRIIRLNKATKIVCIADNIIPHEKRFGDKLFTKYFLQPVHAFVTMSQKVLTDLKQFKPTANAVLTPHPLYDNFGPIIPQTEARQALNLPLNAPIVLFFGFIRKYKGLDILLQAIKILKDSNQINGIKFLIAGEYYEDKTQYEQLVDELDIAEHLILHTDFIPDHAVKNYFCSANLVIQPYKNATQSGVTPLAYHFEKPMIVTNVGGLPDMVPHKKVGLVAAPNANDIAAKIVEFFTIGENFFTPFIMEEKKKFNWPTFTQKIITLANFKN
jgi:glycosyltransferase involved in cell wall biosynthesis